jgi:CheY-like chemotaxis protein
VADDESLDETTPQPESSPSSSGTDAEHRDEQRRRVLIRTLLVALIVGILVNAVLAGTVHLDFAAATLWGFALYVSGLFLGLLFGIPRIADREREAQAEAVSGAMAAKADRPAAPKAASLRAATSANSNLVEISDWLTKIIVGVGLVELKQLPAHGESLATFMAKAMAPESATSSARYVPIAGAIALFFGVLGFITGYLITRVFLSVLLNIADRDADQARDEIRLPTGRTQPVTDVVGTLVSAVADLQNKVTDAAMQAISPRESGDGSSKPSISSTSGSAVHSRTVLWVDDKPEQNVLQVEILRAAGVQVLEANDTSTALRLLGSHVVTLVITDIHRSKEGSPKGDPAGLQFLRAVAQHRSGDTNLPELVVYSSRNSAERYRLAAISAGATLVTSSPTDLLAKLRSVFGPL